MDGDDELVDWLVSEIKNTTYLERLLFIGECISLDTKAGDAYTTDAQKMQRLRAEWAEKKRQLDTTAGSMPSVQGESTD